MKEKQHSAFRGDDSNHSEEAFEFMNGWHRSLPLRTQHCLRLRQQVTQSVTNDNCWWPNYQRV